MGFLVSLFSTGEGRSLENPSTSLSAPDDWLGDALGSFKASSGVRVNRETALTYSAIWKGVNLISGDVGKLPVHVEELQTGGRRRAIDHPAYFLLRRKPNDAMTAFVFRQTLMGHALLDGNGYAYIWRNGAGEPVELSMLAPRQVTPVRYNGQLWYVYQFLDGSVRKIPYTDVLHIKGFSFDGLMGYNLIHKARESLGWAMAMQTYGAIFFRNNATPRVVLMHPAHLKPDTSKNLRESFERMHSGLENAHRTAVLEEGMKAQVISINAKDAQLIEQLKFTFIDVANWLKLPPHKVGGDGRTAYASLEQENQAYLDDCLDGWLVTWEEECWDKLMTEEEKRSGRYDVRFDRKQLLRANLSERGGYYVSAVQWGWMSRDEIREEEGMNPIESGEGAKYYRPLNMAIVGEMEVAEDGFGNPVSDSAIKPGEEMIDVPDIRQPNHYSCGASAAMAVGKYFGVGPDTIEEWEAALDTTLERSTHPMRIVGYLSQLGLAVTAAREMTVDDLRSFWRKGMPVICPVQDYGDRRQEGAEFAYGHYLTVIGAAMGFVFCQDSSEDAVIVPGSESIQAPGRVMIAEADWLDVWHDKDIDGNDYQQFGIAVAKELQIDAPAPPPANPPVAGATPPEASDDAKRTAKIVAAVRSMLADVVRRMVRRIGTQGERAAVDCRKWAAWFSGMKSDNESTIREAAAPVERALEALGQTGGIDAWLIERLRSEFLDLSGRCTPAEFPAEIAKLTAALAESLPEEAGRHFVRCGGAGSGKPGPCPEEGETELPSDADDAIGGGYSDLTEVAQDAETQFLESDTVDAVYDAHDALAESAESSMDRAAKEAAAAIEEHYRPDDADHAEDYAGDRPYRQEKFDAAAKEAKDAFMNTLGECRDKAEEHVLAIQSGIKAEAAAALAEVQRTQEKMDAAAEKWLNRLDKAAKETVKAVAGVYGNERLRIVQGESRLQRIVARLKMKMKRRRK